MLKRTSLYRWIGLVALGFPTISMIRAFRPSVTQRTIRSVRYGRRIASLRTSGEQRLQTSTLSSHPSNIVIVGGGLAGLSTAFHFLERCPTPGGSITIFDCNKVGHGGASAVAGGLVHPLSPSGKLVHLGVECLEATKRMVDCAVKAINMLDETKTNRIILGTEIIRIATNPKQMEQLVASAEVLPQYCEWVEAAQLKRDYTSDDVEILGGIRLHNGGCLVLHPPSYLQGLWMACKQMAIDRSFSVEWKECGDDADLVQEVDWHSFDAVVLAAGAGLLQQQLIGSSTRLPVEVVRGQSVELRQQNTVPPLKSALLCGKYVSPLPDPECVLVGATHEYKAQPFSSEQVVSTLHEATRSFYPWDAASVQRVTEGYRVQSQRGRHGRRPVLGRFDWPHHQNAYIFTGLSSRGILNHGYYGNALVGEILGEPQRLTSEEMNWWRDSCK